MLKLHTKDDDGWDSESNSFLLIVITLGWDSELWMKNNVLFDDERLLGR